MMIALPWLRGYKPRSNYQDALVAEIEGRLAAFEGLDGAPSVPPKVADAVADLFVPAPALRDGPRNAVMERLVRKFDPAERDERDRSLGRGGEEFVVEVEKRRLHAAGRRELTADVRWVSRRRRGRRRLRRPLVRSGRRGGSG